MHARVNQQKDLVGDGNHARRVDENARRQVSRRRAARPGHGDHFPTLGNGDKQERRPPPGAIDSGRLQLIARERAKRAPQQEDRERQRADANRQAWSEGRAIVQPRQQFRRGPVKEPDHSQHNERPRQRQPRGAAQHRRPAAQPPPRGRREELQP